jgi:hypothetical protein
MAFGDFTVTRASTKLRIGSNGLYGSVANNVPAFEFNTDGTYRGLLVEPGATNQIRNNSMVGAVAGTPGTLPTNYSGAQGGLTREIIGTGTENGVDYIEIKYSGTATGTVASLVLEGSTQIVATPSQVWTFSSFIKSVSGSPNSYLLRILERTDLGVYVTDSAGSALSVTSTLSRFSFTRTNSANVTTARVQPQIDFVLTIGASYDFTVRIGWPQMETGSVATSPIVTTAGTASRVADVVSLTGASSLIGQTQGTLYAEVDIARAVVGTIIAIDDGDLSDFIAVEKLANLTIRVVIRRASATSATIITSSAVSLGVHKIALGYKDADYALYIDGVQAGTSANATDYPATTLSRVALGLSAYGQFNDRHRSVALFPTRLSNATLQSLTS